MFRRQRRPATLAHGPTVLLPHQMQHLPPKLRVVSTIRDPSCAAMLQTRSPLFPIPLPQPLRLPVAQAHQPRRIHHPQLLAAHSGQHLDSPQLPLAHLCPPQSGLLSEVVLRGHFYRGQKGTLSSRYNILRCAALDGLTTAGAFVGFLRVVQASQFTCDTLPASKKATVLFLLHLAHSDS